MSRTMESTHQHHGLELSAERREVYVRAVAAVALLVVFYVLAALVALVLGVGTFLALRALGGVGSFFVGGSLGAATVVLLGSVVPRGPRFVPPGPELTRATHA